MNKTLNKLNQLKDLITKHKQLSDNLYNQEGLDKSISLENTKANSSGNLLRSSSAVSFKVNEENKVIRNHISFKYK
jgi:hypothetical protein